MAVALKAMTTDMGADALKPQFRKWISERRKKTGEVYSQFLNRVTTDEAYVEDYELGGFGPFQKKDEGDLINFVAPPTGRKTKYESDMYQAAFGITYEDKKFNRIGKVAKYLKRMERAARLTAEQIAHLPLNLAFSSSFKGSDGQPMVSATHVLLNGDVVSNTGIAADLSQASIEAGVTVFVTAKDHDGFPLGLMPKYLVVHPSSEIAAQRFIGSSNYFANDAAGHPTGADTGVVNVLKKYGITVISDPYIVDEDAWFLLAEKDEHEVQAVWSELPKDRSWDDQSTMDSMYSMFFMLVSGFSTFMGVYGNTGA